MLHLVVYILVLRNFHGVVNSLNDEGYALKSFKTSIINDPEGSLKNWNFSDENPCFWNGISCKDKKVVSLLLPSKKLSGFLSTSLGSLLNLRHLNLRNNNLSGSLPLELFEARGLQSLFLYGNGFSGSLPNEIGNLSYLQHLDLSDNAFNGFVPSTIIHCKRLKGLVLSKNNFSGGLPSGLGSNLVSLEKLDVSYNSFSGLVPNDLGNLSNLEGTLDLSHNVLSGSIPASLGNLPEKVYIDLTYNNLSGPIPQNGALINRGPTAFLGNPSLCGPPLKNACSDSDASSPSSLPFLPSSFPTTGSRHRKGLSKSAIIAIIVGDVIGICVIGLLCSYCYTKICAKSARHEGKEVLKGRKECLCFRKDDQSEILSENVEQLDLVALDTQVAFDLDELLKASAFVLGKSGIGILYKVVLEGGVTLAVRRLGEGGSQRFKEFQTEVEAIGKLRHPNIVTLRAYYWSVDEKLLIYEFVPNGDLGGAIHGKPGMVSFKPLSWSVRLKLIKGITKGLAYLHEFSPKKYIHGDLKPSNILLDQNMEPKIADFGLGRLLNIAGATPKLHSDRMSYENPTQRKQSNTPSEVGTLSCYQAPEALKVVKPSQKWDVYSYGVILLEILTGRGALEIDLPRWIQICVEEKKPLSDVLDPCLTQEAGKEEEIISVLNIALVCVNSSPERRPSMRHVFDLLERLPSSSN